MSAALNPSNVAASAARHAPKALEYLARLGYASRGVIYLIIGGLAVMAAIGAGGETTDSKGAVLRLLELPGGWILVLVLAIGLVGYSSWRFCQSVLDADSLGRDRKAVVIRGAMFVSSLTHLFLALWAGKLALGAAVNGSESEESMVATLMAQPFGRWLVGIVGVAIIAAGIAQFAKGHRETFERRFHWDYNERRRLIWFCKFGLYARGVVFAIIGSFVAYSAVTTNPSDAGGLQEAMQWLMSQPFGAWLLAVMAVGLICFGIYSGVAAVYRRVDPPT